MLSSTFSFNPVPQAFKPLLDLYANKDSFTGRAIESRADQRLRPQDRYSERTPEVAKFLGGLGCPTLRSWSKASIPRCRQSRWST